MKKMVFMAAFVAATAAFVACSSNDDLVQQKPDVPEEMVDEGVPMKIIVSDLATRGTDLTASTLEGFTLYSTMSGWTSGKDLGKDNSGSWTTNDDLTWPDGNEYTFYGISDVDNLTKVIVDSHEVPQIPTVSESSVSFGYTMPQEENPSGDYWCNSESLPDLLVAKNTGSSSLNDGALTVDFTHALAQIKAINIYVNDTRLKAKNVTDGYTYRFRINGIRLGGLKYVGTYTFGATSADGTWVVSGDDTEFTIPLDPTKLTFADMSFQPGDDKSTGITLPLTDGGLYLIPQVANGSFVKDEYDYYLSEGAYAELDAQVFVYQEASYTSPDDEGRYKCPSSATQVYFDQEGSDDTQFGIIRVPLKFTLSPGYGYTLTLDLGRAAFYDGQFEGMSIFTGITFDSGS